MSLIANMAISAEFAVQLSALSEEETHVFSRTLAPAGVAIKAYVHTLMKVMKDRGEWDSVSPVALFLPVAPPDAGPGTTLAWKVAAALVEREIADKNDLTVKELRQQSRDIERRMRPERG